MAKSGLIPFTAKTPLPDLPSVELSLERWNDHIISNHAEMAGKESLLLETLTAPTMIVKGNPEENLVFVNHNETKSNGSPLVVVVNRPRAFVLTALYDRRYKTIISGQQIWPS